MLELLVGILLGIALCGGALWLRGRRHAHHQELVESAVQGSPTGVIIIDPAGAVVLANARAHALGIVEQGHLTPEVWQHAQKVLADGQDRTIDLHKQPAGSRVSAVQAIVKPLAGNVIVYCTDESESVRMESARRDFVANVSHELKTPVGGMALLAEALLESRDDPETVEHFGTKLTKEAHRLAALINELIALSKLQGAEALPNMEPVRIDAVIDDAIQRTQLAADNAGIVIERGPASGAVVLGDETLLVTAVSNLLNNAINYSPAATPVSITQSVLGDTVHIRVTDRGIGIAPEDQQRVFERFFRVDKARSRATGGTGLGLAIVKHVAANHGGAITLWSRPGVGSTFTLELPMERTQQP